MKKRCLTLGVILPLTLVASGQVPSTEGIGWAAPMEIPTPTTFIDYVPSIVRDNQGVLWVFWEGIRLSPSVQQDIYYKTYNGSGWYPSQTDLKLASSLFHQEITPGALALRNGSIFVAWASKRSGNYDLYYKMITNGIPSVERRLTNGTSDETAPAPVQAADGSIWVFWNKFVNNSYDIYYKVYDGISWSPEGQLTSNLSIDLSPAALVTKDGRIWVAWSSYRTGEYEIFVKSYDETSWSADSQVTFHSADDDGSPTLVQDRDGTLWILWSRTLNAPSGEVQTDIYYKTSLDNGGSWSAEDTALTNTSDFSENDLSVVQGADRSLWLVFSSDPGRATFGIFYVTSEPILTHDLSVRDVRANPEKASYNTTVLADVTVVNMGDFPETAEVKVYAGSILAAAVTTSILPAETKTMSLAFNTLSIRPGRYDLTAEVTPTPGETSGNQGDNFLESGRLHALPPGDIDRDGDVDIRDAGTAISAFDSVPGSPNWNQKADIDMDGDVDIIDVSVTLLWFDTVT